VIQPEHAIPQPPQLPDSAPHVTLLVRKAHEPGVRISCNRVVTLIGSRHGVRANLQSEKVAPVHLAIVNNGSDVYAVDMLSPTGTLLNGLKMQHEKLGDGDRLEIDTFDFAVEIRKPARNGNGDLHLDLEPAPQAIALEHIETGRLLQPNRPVCLIGRRHGCDVVLDDNQVSRAHALLLTYNERPAILDLLTPAKTFVNDEPVGFQSINDGDVVTIGDAKFRVRVVEPKVVAKPPSTTKSAVAPVLTSSPLQAGPDLIDIQATEGSQRWRVAEDLDKLEKAGASNGKAR
jgi:pSer/pThr/pTyr-binding forkhead associated (FHA) protein